MAALLSGLVHRFTRIATPDEYTAAAGCLQQLNWILVPATGAQLLTLAAYIKDPQKANQFLTGAWNTYIRWSGISVTAAALTAALTTTTHGVGHSITWFFTWACLPPSIVISICQATAQAESEFGAYGNTILLYAVLKLLLINGLTKIAPTQEMFMAGVFIGTTITAWVAWKYTVWRRARTTRTEANRLPIIETLRPTWALGICYLLGTLDQLAFQQWLPATQAATATAAGALFKTIPWATNAITTVVLPRFYRKHHRHEFLLALAFNTAVSLGAGWFLTVNAPLLLKFFFKDSVFQATKTLLPSLTLLVCLLQLNQFVAMQIANRMTKAMAVFSGAVAAGYGFWLFAKPASAQSIIVGAIFANSLFLFGLLVQHRLLHQNRTHQPAVVTPDALTNQA